MQSNTDLFSPQHIGPQASVRTAFTLIALAGMLLPWVTLDGSGSSMSGADLIAYSFTGNERAAMIRITLIGSAVLFTFPLLTLFAAVMCFLDNIKGELGVPWSLLAAVSPMAMLIVAAPVLSSDQGKMLGIPIPDWGMFMTAGAHLSLILMAATCQPAGQDEGTDDPGKRG